MAACQWPLSGRCKLRWCLSGSCNVLLPQWGGEQSCSNAIKTCKVHIDCFSGLKNYWEFFKLHCSFPSIVFLIVVIVVSATIVRKCRSSVSFDSLTTRHCSHSGCGRVCHTHQEPWPCGRVDKIPAPLFRCGQCCCGRCSTVACVSPRGRSYLCFTSVKKQKPYLVC